MRKRVSSLIEGTRKVVNPIQYARPKVANRSGVMEELSGLGEEIAVVARQINDLVLGGRHGTDIDEKALEVNNELKNVSHLTLDDILESGVKSNPGWSGRLKIKKSLY